MTDRHLGLARLLGAEVDSTRLVEELRAVIDPELGVNISDLGLVYGAQMVDGVAHILMTTTTPARPIGSYLRDGDPLGAAAGRPDPGRRGRADPRAALVSQPDEHGGQGPGRYILGLIANGSLDDVAAAVRWVVMTRISTSALTPLQR